MAAPKKGAEQDVASTVAILREMGANTIRLTHYQHGQPIHDIADRTGIVLWDEISLVTTWTFGEDPNPTPELLANARQQLQELVRLYGADRILMGTDYPFDMADYDPVGHVCGADLDAAMVAAICGGNTQRLLGI